MSRRPDLKAVSGTNGKNGRREASPAVKEQRSPLALIKPDWIALALLAAALALAPLWAANLPTPGREAFRPDNPLSPLMTAGIPAILALTAAAFVVIAWRESKRPVAIGAVPGLAGACVLLTLWSVVSMVRSPAMYLSLDTLAVLLATLLLAGLVSRLGRDRRGFAALLFAMLAGASFMALLGLREYLEMWKLGAPYYRVFATFINPNFLAGYLLLTVPITLSAFASASDKTTRLALGVGLFLQSSTLLLTGSRAGVGILLIALVLWLVLIGITKSAAGYGKQIAAGFVIFAIGASLAFTPIVSRVFTPKQAATAVTTQASATDQNHSAEFRRYTWIGTLDMVKANPILGTGIGTYSATYPRYAITAFTAHAHNSFLQWAGETGVPGVLLLLTALAAATSFAFYILLLPPRKQPMGESPWEQDARTGSTGNTPQAALFGNPRLLLAGFLTAILAFLLHNLLDSIWYTVGTAITFGGVIGLTIALARDQAPLASQTPRPLATFMVAGGMVIVLFLFWRAWATGTSRFETAAADAAARKAAPDDALADSRAAAAADPFDPEPRLLLATLYRSMHQSDQEREALLDAARVAHIGKAYYRLGQAYQNAGDYTKAIDEFRQARTREPNNTQNLRALAETLRQAQRPQEAKEVYQTVTALEHQPFGRIRALPEKVETDFAYAHVGLAEIAAAEQQWKTADTEYSPASAVLREFWRTRKNAIPQQFAASNPARYQEDLALYDKVLTDWQAVLTHIEPPGSARTAEIANEQRQFRAEQAQDTQAAAQTGTGAQ